MKLQRLKSYIHNNVEYIVFALLAIFLVYLLISRNWENFTNESNGINSMDAIIYINLENRQDRKDLLMKELEKLDTNMSKVHKVSGVYIPKNGHKGCIQSHILAFHMIKLNKWKRVLILEDDAELDMSPESINDLISKSLTSLDEKHPDWNVIMLATANKTIDNKTSVIPLDVSIPAPENANSNTSSNSDSTKKTTLNIQKLNTATTSSAYIIKDSYVDNILSLFKHCNNNMTPDKLTSSGFENWALDQKWAELQSKDKWFCYDKDPIKQRAIWSTIMSESHT